MTANIGEIVTQLKQAIERIDVAAVAAMRLGKDAGTAHSAFQTAGKGSDHPKIKQAITDAAEAAAKADKLARLFAESANALTEYINVIAPGSTQERKPTHGGSPAGEHVAGETVGRGSLSNKLLGRTGAVKNADDGLQHGKKIGNVIQEAVAPRGSAAGQPKSPQPESPGSQPGAGDAIIGAAVVAIIGLKGAELAAHLRRKVKSKSEKERNDDE